MVIPGSVENPWIANLSQDPKNPGTVPKPSRKMHPCLGGFEARRLTVLTLRLASQQGFRVREKNYGGGERDTFRGQTGSAVENSNPLSI